MKRFLLVKRLISAFLLLLIVLLCAACSEPKAKTENYKTFSDQELVFKYPGNWEISEKEKKTDFRYLIIESPGDAIVIIQIYYSGDTPDLKRYAEIFAENAQNEMPVGSMGGSHFSEVDEVQGYSILHEDFMVSLLGQDIPHKRIYRLKRGEDKSLYILCQVAEEDFLKVEKGFDLVVSSFELL